jgi:NAD(P) transhydrogenase subunit alpha
MHVGVLRERARGEHRVALVPEGVARLTKAGHRVAVEIEAGMAAGFPDAAYEEAGGRLTAAGEAAGADLVASVRRPTQQQIEAVKKGAVVVALMQPGSAEAAQTVAALRARSARVLSLERVPRISKAQSMDVLSSQSTVAGYKAVLVGASSMGRFLPMLTTAAGTIAPARAFILGAGVAGLQAIATARRLGAIVSAFDVRAAVREQVQSLGASFVAAQALDGDAEAAGGYARAQTEDEQARTTQAIATHVASQDLVITTALIPGRPAPRLITEEMVASMRPGSVIVDLAAESGGNCELSRPDETVVAHDVIILGPTNLPSTVPYHASQMFSRNVEKLLEHLAPDGNLALDPEDAIVQAMELT